MSDPILIRTDIFLDADLDKVHETACKVAAQLHDTTTDTPCMYVIDNGIALMWIDCVWETEAEKDFHAHWIAGVLKRTDAQHYAFISEGYFKRIREDAGTDLEVARDDCFFVHTTAKDGKFRFTRWRTDMLESGERRMGDPEHLHDSPEITGLLANLFARPIGDDNGN